MTKTSSVHHRFGEKRLLVTAAILVLAAGSWWALPEQSEPDEDQIAQVIAALNRGDVPAARQQLESLIQQFPEYWPLQHKLAEVCRQSGDLRAELKWLTRIPDDTGAMPFRAARLAMQMADPSTAREQLIKAIEAEFQTEDATRQLAALEYLLTDYNAMRSHLASLDEIGRFSVNDLILYCSDRHTVWPDDAHLDWLRQAMDNSPRDIAAGAALAWHLQSSGDDDSAREIIDAHSDLAATGDWRVWLARAEQSGRRGDMLRAGQALQELDSTASADARAWRIRGVVCEAAGQLKAACDAFETAALLAPFDPELPLRLASLCHRDDRSEEAEMHEARADTLRQISHHCARLAEADSPIAVHLSSLARELAEAEHWRAAFLCVDLLRRESDPGQIPESLTVLVSRGATESLLPADMQPGLAASLSGPGDGLAELTTHPEKLQLPSHAERNDATFRLRDVSSDAGVDFEFEAGNSGRNLLLETLGGGGAAFDLDGDSFPDLYFSQGRGLNPELEGEWHDTLLRNLDGQLFVDATFAAGFVSDSQHEYGHGCAAMDFDNDGFCDILICRFGRNRLLHNNGDGTLSDVTEMAGLNTQAWSTSAGWGDFDSDGDPDLYVSSYVEAELETFRTCRSGGEYVSCRPWDFPPAGDELWENLGDGQFAQRTIDREDSATDTIGLGVLIGDFDADSAADVFVGNDTTRNLLFMNKSSQNRSASGIVFSESGVLMGVAYNDAGQSEACMGIAAGDIDRNGSLDLFVTNYERETNTLYLQSDIAGFSDRTREFGLARTSFGMLGWGTQLVDLDADTDLDLILVNGHLTDYPMRAQLFANQEGAGFLPAQCDTDDFFATAHAGRAVIQCDWNNDLAPDFVVTTRTGPYHLLENETDGGNQLKLRLIGVDSARQPVATRVVVTTRQQQTGQLVSGGYLASHEPVLHFGLGPDPVAEQVVIYWPEGGVSELNNIAAGSWTIVEGSGEPIRSEDR